MNITKPKWYGAVNIVLGLALSLVLLFPSLVHAEAAGKPSITNSEGKLLQFTADGHILGFAGDGVIIASARHMLRIDFLNSGAVVPEADGDVSEEGDVGAAPPLGRVTYRDVWPGVTVVYEANAASIVKSTYYVDATKEGTRVDSIRLGYNRPVQVDERGNLLVTYEDGTIVEGAPVAWQETESGRKPVTAGYVIRGEREVGFSLGDYMPGIPVVIDPVMTWNTFLGDSGADYGYGIAVDGSGNVYVGGYSTATWGSPVRAYTSSWDAYAAKLDINGNLTWNTFLGGSSNDFGQGIAVDSSGNVYVGGYSDATWGSPVRAYTSSGNDAFAAKLDLNGNFVPGWASYIDSGRTILSDNYTSPNTTVYMNGANISNVSYLIAYYDNGGTKRSSETQSASGGNLTSAYLLATDATAAGTWHTLVQPSSGYTGFGTDSYAMIVASPDTYGWWPTIHSPWKPRPSPSFPLCSPG